jgi:hypothetical protein
MFDILHSGVVKTPLIPQLTQAAVILNADNPAAESEFQHYEHGSKTSGLDGLAIVHNPSLVRVQRPQLTRNLRVCRELMFQEPN